MTDTEATYFQESVTSCQRLRFLPLLEGTEYRHDIVESWGSSRVHGTHTLSIS